MRLDMLEESDTSVSDVFVLSDLRHRYGLIIFCDDGIREK